MADKAAIQKRAQRIRRQIKKVAGDRPRLSVHRTSKNIYVQLIDDAKGHTIAAASTLEKDFKAGKKTGADSAAAAAVERGGLAAAHGDDRTERYRGARAR